MIAISMVEVILDTELELPRKILFPQMIEQPRIRSMIAISMVVPFLWLK